ncbi:hypothetical protein Swit_2173 [Rhizorhabdus wittichii RW1]|uniref:Uncharacterized protein n=1 Tax=Rhizorhabdus wittichii (strain DSM 6014 / CCUG 31198 / JCM 15750 / NBRC 105917 / EY 4224 / RW1) TaxID=392499 RepID=A0A9J9HBL8_RHIWR|nr:hypothetical protein Swit_2173 [Rhizorhabdus wittichii RW1]
MKRYDLRAADAAALAVAFAAAAIAPALIMVIDVIGEIAVPTGEVDEDGAPIHEAVEGWHANLYTAEELEPEQLAALPIIPTPATPWRVLAGEPFDAT